MLFFSGRDSILRKDFLSPSIDIFLSSIYGQGMNWSHPGIPKNDETFNKRAGYPVGPTSARLGADKVRGPGLYNQEEAVVAVGELGAGVSTAGARVPGTGRAS